MLNKKTGQIYSVTKIVSLTLLLSTSAMAEDNSTNDEELADMSDPLAAYTMAGVGVTNRGLFLKAAKTYDTGNPKTMGMNLIELKGIYSDDLGWEDDTVNSIDSLRVRNLSVITATGTGAQIDLSYAFNTEIGSLSYSIMQAFQKMWRFNLYPLAGAGVVLANNFPQDEGTIASGYSFPGVFATAAMYGKFTITDKIWLNYNPIWNTTLSGSDLYKDYSFEGHNSVLLHEAIISYQINIRTNVRYFANWSQYTDFGDGDHRLELNYQF